MPPRREVERPAAARDGGLGRRRQVDAHRPAAVRLEDAVHRPARRGRAHLEGARPRLHGPLAPDRRPPRRARAGDHDRRRLPLLRHAEAAVHHRGHPGPHPVHAEHGHRRLDGGRRGPPARCPPGHHRAEPAPRVHRVAARACRTSSCASTRWTWSTGRRTRSSRSATSSSSSPRASGSATCRSSRSRRCTATTSSASRRTCPGTTGCRSCATSSACTSPPTGTWSTCASRSSTSSGPQSHTVIDYRGYAGTVASGVLKPGDQVMVLPSGLETTIESIETADGPVDEAFPPMSVTITLKDHLDISRGDMLCRPHNVPTVAQEIDAQVCWMDESAPMTKGGKYAIKHTTRWARAVVRDIAYRIDVNTLHRDETVGLARAERDRARAAAGHPAAVRRHLPGEPRRPARSSSSTSARTRRSAPASSGGPRPRPRAPTAGLLPPLGRDTAIAVRRDRERRRRSRRNPLVS